MEIKYDIYQVLKFYKQCNEYYNILDGLHPLSTTEEIMSAVVDYLHTFNPIKLFETDVDNIGKLLRKRKYGDTQVIGGVDFTDSIKALDSLGNDLVK